MASEAQTAPANTTPHVPNARHNDPSEVEITPQMPNSPTITPQTMDPKQTTNEVPLIVASCSFFMVMSP